MLPLLFLLPLAVAVPFPGPGVFPRPLLTPYTPQFRSLSPFPFIFHQPHLYNIPHGPVFAPQPKTPYQQLAKIVTSPFFGTRPTFADRSQKPVTGALGVPQEQFYECLNAQCSACLPEDFVPATTSELPKCTQQYHNKIEMCQATCGGTQACVDGPARDVIVGPDDAALQVCLTQSAAQAHFAGHGAWSDKFCVQHCRRTFGNNFVAARCNPYFYKPGRVCVCSTCDRSAQKVPGSYQCPEGQKRTLFRPLHGGLGDQMCRLGHINGKNACQQSCASQYYSNHEVIGFSCSYDGCKCAKCKPLPKEVKKIAKKPDAIQFFCDAKTSQCKQCKGTDCPDRAVDEKAECTEFCSQCKDKGHIVQKTAPKGDGVCSVRTDQSAAEHGCADACQEKFGSDGFKTSKCLPLNHINAGSEDLPDDKDLFHSGFGCFCLVCDETSLLKGDVFAQTGSSEDGFDDEDKAIFQSNVAHLGDGHEFVSGDHAMNFPPGYGPHGGFGPKGIHGFGSGNFPIVDPVHLNAFQHKLGNSPAIFIPEIKKDEIKPPVCGPAWQSQCSQACNFGYYTFLQICDKKLIQKWYPCNTHPCPVDCEVAQWSDWSACSAPCGPHGTTYRWRQVIVPPQYGGLACPGPLKQSFACNRGKACESDAYLKAAPFGPLPAPGVGFHPALSFHKPAPYQLPEPPVPVPEPLPQAPHLAHSGDAALDKSYSSGQGSSAAATGLNPGKVVGYDANGNPIQGTEGQLVGIVPPGIDPRTQTVGIPFPSAGQVGTVFQQNPFFSRFRQQSPAQFATSQGGQQQNPAQLPTGAAGQNPAASQGATQQQAQPGVPQTAPTQGSWPVSHVVTHQQQLIPCNPTGYHPLVPNEVPVGPIRLLNGNQICVPTDPNRPQNTVDLIAAHFGKACSADKALTICHAEFLRCMDNNKLGLAMCTHNHVYNGARCVEQTTCATGVSHL